MMALRSAIEIRRGEFSRTFSTIAAVIGRQPAWCETILSWDLPRIGRDVRRRLGS